MVPRYRFVCRCLLVGTAVLLSLPAHADVLRSPKGYTVTIPHNWETSHEVDTLPDGWQTDMMLSHPHNALPLFRIEVCPRGVATMKNPKAMQAAFVQKTMPGFQVLQQRITRVAGSSASETAAVGHYQGQPVLLDMIFTIHAGKSYTMTLISTPRTLKTDLKTFAHIINTLKWS